MSVISKSPFGARNEELYEKFGKFLEHDEPETFFTKEVKRHIKEMRPIAEKIRVTTDTPGWQEVIKPFLESQSNPKRVFKTFKSNINEIERAYITGKNEAYYNFLMLIKNFMNILNFPAEDKKEEKK